MPKAKAKRTLADDLTAEDIREAFARAGSERKLKPNAALVQQGKACSSVFLVLEGALRAGSDRPIGVGAFVGEVSFLLGGAPTLGVTATVASVVAEVKHDALQRICVEDPALAGAIFKALAATLAERVHESVAARASLVHGSEPASDAVPEALERSSAELRDDFGLPPSAGALLAHAAGVAALERESVAEDGTSATAFLFASHLCVEQLAFGFTTRVAIKLSDVLAVLKGNRPDSPLRKKPKQAPRKGPVAAVAGSGSSDTEIIVQARNCSVTLDLAAGCEAFARALEASRLAARAMPPPPPAAAASKPPPLKRRASSIAWVSGAAAAGKADTPNLMPELARALEPPKKKAPKAAAGARLGALSPAQWAAVMAGAERRRWRDGELVLEEGAEGRALYQLVKGSLKVAFLGRALGDRGRLAAGARLVSARSSPAAAPARLSSLRATWSSSSCRRPPRRPLCLRRRAAVGAVRATRDAARPPPPRDRCRRCAARARARAAARRRRAADERSARATPRSPSSTASSSASARAISRSSTSSSVSEPFTARLTRMS